MRCPVDCPVARLRKQPSIYNNEELLTPKEVFSCENVDLFVCPSGAFLKVQANSETNRPGEPSGRLRNLLVRVSGTQPSLLHDSHSHAPAAFPMVVGNQSKRQLASADGKKRFEHRCLRRRGEESGVPCAPLSSVLAGTPVVVGVVGVVLGPLSFDLLARLLRRLHRRRALERLVLRRPPARLLHGPI